MVCLFIVITIFFIAPITHHQTTQTGQVSLATLKELLVQYSTPTAPDAQDKNLLTRLDINLAFTADRRIQEVYM